MFLDYPTITATHSQTEPDRLERLTRVYGYAVAVADFEQNREFIHKIAQLHDHKGTLIVFWHDTPTEEEKFFFSRAWASQVGDGTMNVEHEV